MSRIDITLTSSTHSEFHWLNSFKSLEEKDIEKTILILRDALTVFSAKLTDRRKSWTNQALEINKKKIQKTVKHINEQGLTEMHEVNLNSLKLSLTQAECAQTERKESKPSKAERQYLWLIPSVIDWPYCLLIICVLDKHKIKRINEDQRVKLLKYIVKHRKSLFCCKLEERISQFQKNCVILLSILSCVLRYCRYQSRPFTYSRL